MAHSDPRKLIELAQRNETLEHEIMPLVAGLDAADLGSLASMIMDYTQRRDPPTWAVSIPGETLERCAINFHQKAGTDTPAVLANIGSLRDNGLRIRVAHQPNLFPSLGIVSQFIFVGLLAKHLAEAHGAISTTLFVMVDYDIAQDQRFRIAHIPDPLRRTGSLSLSGSVPKGLFGNLMWTVSKPPIAIVQDWIAQIRLQAKSDIRALRKVGITERSHGFILSNVELLERIIYDAYQRASNLVEFNTFVLSQIINRYWDMPIAFISGRDLQRHLQKAYEFILADWRRIWHLFEDAVTHLRSRGVHVRFSLHDRDMQILPVWIRCRNQYARDVCNYRVPLVNQSEERLIAHGRCAKCQSEYRFDLGDFSTPNLDPLRGYDVSPRVLMDNLLDIVGLSIGGGTQYIGAAEHMLLTNYVTSHLGWEMPPHCLWSPQGVHYGLAEYRASIIMANRSTLPRPVVRNAGAAIRWAYSGKASILYYLMNQGFAELHRMWSDFLEDGNHVWTENNGQCYSPVEARSDLVAKLMSATRIARYGQNTD